MPTYEYSCMDCGYRMDIRQSFSEEPITKCPKCKKNTFKKLISGGLAIMDMTPKTLGSIADRNAREMRRMGIMPESEKKRRARQAPWWRKGTDRPIFESLKDPKKWIESGANE